MPVHNADVAAVFEEIADLLEIQGANPFRVRAYRGAARMLSELSTDVRELADDPARLDALPGIGKDLAAKIAEIVTTGRCAALEKLRRSVPSSVAELLRIPGLGPKRVATLWHELDIQRTEQLLKAAQEGRIRALHGFGPKIERTILEAAGAHLGRERRLKLASAAHYAEALCRHLLGAKGVREVAVAGSYRRMRETVGDLDVLAAAGARNDVMARFLGYDEVAKTLARGDTRASVVLGSGLQVDLRLVAPESFGAALLYFTGSKAHNIALRRLAQGRGLKVNEYGLFRRGKRVAGQTEEEMYAALGLAWIPPELREDRGEIEAAAKGTLPRLVELSDLRGDLHAHTRATDGHETLEAMASAARDMGFEYLAITEHSRRQTVSHGLDPRRLAAQGKAIDALNARQRGFRLLKGIEVDILPDGTLDLPDSALERLDLVVAAVHGSFGLTRARQTERILSALDNPHVALLAHPTGRLIGQREPYDVDMLAVLRKAKEAGVHMEVNAHPSRLDLLDTHCQMARDEGVLVAVNSDAHSALDFANLRFGVGQARRGWLTAEDVLNTRGLRDVLALLRRPAR